MNMKPSELDAFLKACPAEIFAVTGTNGKTTTAAIIQKFLQDAGYTCWLASGEETSLFGRVDEILPEHKVVLEINSFELNSTVIKPHVAVITNITPNHLDVYSTAEEYAGVKSNIYRNQNADDILVLNNDNAKTRSFSNEAASKVIFFGRSEGLTCGALLRDGILGFLQDGKFEPVLERKDIQLPGEHNVENFLAAIAATRDYVTPETVRKSAAEIGSIAHRMEFVREINGTSYYDDSCGSNPARTIAALNSFDQRFVLISGGNDKKLSYEPLGPILAKKAKHLILIGQTASMIEIALMANLRGKNAYNDVRITHCSTLEQAVYAAYFSAKKGEIVLLSPASATPGTFRDFAEMGSKFKDLVNRL